MAGLCSHSVRQTTVVNWMLLGVYFTREFLYKMKKVKSPECLGCSNQTNESIYFYTVITTRRYRKNTYLNTYSKTIT